MLVGVIVNSLPDAALHWVEVRFTAVQLLGTSMLSIAPAGGYIQGAALFRCSSALSVFGHRQKTVLLAKLREPFEVI